MHVCWYTHGENCSFFCNYWWFSEMKRVGFFLNILSNVKYLGLPQLCSWRPDLTLLWAAYMIWWCGQGTRGHTVKTMSVISIRLRTTGPMDPSQQPALLELCFLFPKWEFLKAGLSALSSLPFHTHLRKADSFQGLQHFSPILYSLQSPFTGVRGYRFESRLLPLLVLGPWDIYLTFPRLGFSHL